MKIEMSYLLLAFATVLAPLAQGPSPPPQPKITGVLTILTPKPGVTPEQVMKIMPAEIRATVLLLSRRQDSAVVHARRRPGRYLPTELQGRGGGSGLHRKPTSLEGKPRGRAVHPGRATLSARDTPERQLNQ
ncbi:MAG TPA: hypothetical protein VIW93_03890 [Candidatus Acidoferrum sp.]